MWQRRVRTDGSKADVSRLANAEYSLEITYSQSGQSVSQSGQSVSQSERDIMIPSLFKG